MSIIIPVTILYNKSDRKDRRDKEGPLFSDGQHIFACHKVMYFLFIVVDGQVNPLMAMRRRRLSRRRFSSMTTN